MRFDYYVLRATADKKGFLKMHRFHCSSENVLGKNIIISDGDQAHHIRDVLRLKAGDKIEAFDENGNIYRCSIKCFEKNRAILDIEENKLPMANNRLKVTIACAIPKNCKMEDIIDKLTQLGVDRIVPLLTERVIVKMHKDREKTKLHRWRKIAQFAAEQSKRSDVPTIDSPKRIEKVLLESHLYGLKLIPTLYGRRFTLKDILERSQADKIIILIGPEGDFTDSEVALAKKSGFIPVTLGKTVLRVETAALSIMSFINFYENS